MTEAVAAMPHAAAPSTEDAALVRRAAEGDADAFAEIFDRHRDAVWGCAWRILRRTEDAEDAAQDAFAKAWRAIATADPQRPLRPWLLAIAARTALDLRDRRQRRERRHGGDGDDAAEAPAPRRYDPRETAAAGELRAALDRAVSSLPEDAATLYHLRYGQDLAIEDVARALQKNPNAVAVALHRLRDRLRAMVFGSQEAPR